MHFKKETKKKKQAPPAPVSRRATKEAEGESDTDLSSVDDESVSPALQQILNLPASAFSLEALTPDTAFIRVAVPRRSPALAAVAASSSSSSAPPFTAGAVAPPFLPAGLPLVRVVFRYS